VKYKFFTNYIGYIVWHFSVNLDILGTTELVSAKPESYSTKFSRDGGILSDLPKKNGMYSNIEKECTLYMRIVSSIVCTMDGHL
jgi:hypothetical protein